uniref:Very short patch repair endonuclease n=1 Tax=Rhodopseudomonas palustris (strain BisA53) TaxID=316055 RepID=Q07LJ7_RHOP5
MMADTISTTHRSWNMSRIRGRDTEPEVKLRSLLHRAGYRFRLHDRNLPGRPDIVLPRYRATIFVHGCFWHRHEGCGNATTPSTRPEFWKAKFDGNVVRDRVNAERLADHGWRVIVVWECDLKKDPGGVLSSINRALRGDR